MNYLLHILETVTNGYRVETLDLISLLSVLASILVIISKNPVLSVLFLIGLFFCIACFLFLLGLNFIGLSYLLVYVGAVSILFLFILMLINVRVSELTTDTTNSIPLVLAIAIFFSYPARDILPINSVTSHTPITGHTLLHAIVNGDLHNLYLILFDNSYAFFVTSKLWDGNLAETTQITSIGNIMYSSYSIWLILTSIILLLAMVGCIVITIKKKSFGLSDNQRSLAKNSANGAQVMQSNVWLVNLIKTNAQSLLIASLMFMAYKYPAKVILDLLGLSFLYPFVAGLISVCTLLIIYGLKQKKPTYVGLGFAFMVATCTIGLASFGIITSCALFTMLASFIACDEATLFMGGTFSFEKYFRGTGDHGFKRPTISRRPGLNSNIPTSSSMERDDRMHVEFLLNPAPNGERLTNHQPSTDNGSTTNNGPSTNNGSSTNNGPTTNNEPTTSNGRPTSNGQTSSNGQTTNNEPTTSNGRPTSNGPVTGDQLVIRTQSGVANRGINGQQHN